MSGMKPKDSRKSKLVQRSSKNGTGTGNDSQNEPPKKRWKEDEDKPKNEASTSSYQPRQFDIKVEVEECDDDEFMDPKIGVLEDSDFKTEIINENDLFEVEERDINSLFAQALKKNKNPLPDSSDDESNYNLALTNDHDYSPENQKRSLIKPTQLVTLQFNEDEMFDSLKALHKNNISKADSILGIEMRNEWGRCRITLEQPSLPEKKIQIALNSWKFWKVSSRGGEVPLMYKCYLCQSAWWHLGPFQEHLKTHDNEFLRVESEPHGQTMQYNIVAFSSQFNHVSNDIPIEERCWRCGYGFEYHIKRTKVYTCTYCQETFNTCTRSRAHEAECSRRLKILVKKGPIVIFTCHICPLKVFYKETLEHHYLEFHKVRSDLPKFDWSASVRSCIICSRNYTLLPFHYCIRKNYTILCTFCGKRFPSKIALDIHSKEEDNYPCAVCNELVPKKCMLADHMMMHTKNFIRLQKCLTCTENVLLFDQESLKRHRIIWHKEKFDKRRNYFVSVLVPRKFIETQRIPGIDTSAYLTKLYGDGEDTVEVIDDSNRSGLSNTDKSKLIEVEIENAIEIIDLDDSPIHIKEEQTDDSSDSFKVKEDTLKDSIKIDLEVLSTCVQIKKENSDDYSAYMVESNFTEASTSVKVKEEKEDFSDLVKEKMIKEMQKNNNFTEDDDGYEYILSSVFNTSSGSALETEIGDEADDFEELINNELKKSNHKSQSKKANKQGLLMTSVLKKVNPEVVKAVIRNFKCDHKGCHFVATDKESLRAHKITHRVVVISCSKCNKPFCTVRSYLNHLPDHGYANWACPCCLRIYSNYSSLATHVRVMAYRSFSKMQFVVKSDGKDKIAVKYECKKCNSAVLNESVLNHWETHLCDEASSVVKVEVEEQDVEVNINNGIEHEEPYERAAEDITSEVMEKVIAALVSTNKRHHENKVCLACGRTFERRNDCKRHHIEHLLTNAYGNKFFYKGLSCQICHKIFERASEYKQHMRDHGHLPLYQCDQCLKTFSDSSNYVKHQKIHGSMYICDICSKRFQAKKSLITHIQSHLSTEPITCMFCPKTFFCDSQFSRHVRNAHNQRLFKYSCIICKKKFKTVKDKWEHMWIVHKERQVKADCPICYAEFRTITAMKRHLNSQHQMDISMKNMRLFRHLLQKMKDGKPIDFEQPVVVKEESPSFDSEQCDGGMCILKLN